MSSPSEGANAPVELGRVFTKGESLSYKVRSNLSAERRGLGLRTWMPEDLDINYDFSLVVEQIKADGIAVVRYKRPTMTIIEGETAEAPPKPTTEKVNFDLALTLSPINEIIDVKDLTVKKAPAKKSNKSLVPAARPTPQELGGILGQFVNEMYRLALFSGSFDSALDFAPKLRSTKVAVGDTWHKTVGYQPQKLKGKDGKSVVQRLDFTYTYKGLVTVNGKKFQRLEASFDHNTDLGEFLNDTFDVKSEDTGIKKLPMRLKSKVEFNLDPVTHHAVLAEANTEGGYEVYVSEYETPVLEMKLRGTTLMQLSKRTVPSVKKK
jgi:hypothetical protein